jgi:hypothetical protein
MVKKHISLVLMLELVLVGVEVPRALGGALLVELVGAEVEEVLGVLIRLLTSVFEISR